jgi:hypothetical protein
MSVWFEDDIEVGCGVPEVQRAVEDHGRFFVGITSLMPGMESVELIEQGDDWATIRTNEGIMKRTKISKNIETQLVTVDFDEVYEAGSKVTARPHFHQEFTANDTGATHRLVMSDVEAPGFLGFLYQRLGSSKMGNAFLKATKAFFEDQDV